MVAEFERAAVDIVCTVRLLESEGCNSCEVGEIADDSMASVDEIRLEILEMDKRSVALTDSMIILVVVGDG